MDAAAIQTTQIDQADAVVLVPLGKSPWEYSYTDELIGLHARTAVVTSAVINWAAGIAWGVYQTPAYIYTGDPPGPTLDSDGYVIEPELGRGFKLVGVPGSKATMPVPGVFMNVRDDCHTVLGVVKQRYRVFQNDEAPVFLDQIAASGEMRYETAGGLHGGAQVWWLMKSPTPVNLAGDPRETLTSYLLLTNSHDGSVGVTVAALALRLSSNTTLAWSLPTTPRTMAVKHTDSASGKQLQAENAVDLARSYQLELATLADRMLHAKLTEDDFTTFLNTLVPTPAPRLGKRGVANQRGITMAENTKGQITQVYYNSDLQSHLIGTLWGVVQACQFCSDHFSINRNTDSATASENRFKRLTSEGNLGSRAFALALTLL